MTSKRSSRLYVDDVTHHKESHQHSTETYHQLPRNSRNVAAEDLPQVREVEEASEIRPLPREVVSASRSQVKEASEKDSFLSVLPKVGNMPVPVAGPLMTSIMSQPIGLSLVPTEGRPMNFGIVLPGVYRSSYPKAEDYGFLQALQLKTVVTLVKKDEEDHKFKSFVAANGIRQVVFNMKGTKKEAIPASTMSSILHLVLDKQNYPLLLHCNHGKHRTGCAVAAVRKISGWDVERALDEYKTYATPKIRECDVDYITSFQSIALESTSIRTLKDGSARFTSVQIRSFLRTLLFSTLVVTIWLVSGSQIVATQDRILH